MSARLHNYIKRLELYHEIRHYKIQLYNDLRDEVMHQIEQSVFVKMFDEARKVKGRIVDPDLRPLTEKLFKRLEKG